MQLYTVLCFESYYYHYYRSRYHDDNINMTLTLSEDKLEDFFVVIGTSDAIFDDDPMVTARCVRIALFKACCSLKFCFN